MSNDIGHESVTYTPEKPSVEALSLMERINPKVTPALGLQSYEWLETDTARKDEMTAAFLRGERDDIPLTYTKLFDSKGLPNRLDEERQSLEDLMTDLRDPETDELDDETAEMTFYSAIYRYHEVNFIETVQDLNRSGASKDELIQTAERYRRLNEALYGRPDPKIYSQIKGEIWHVLDNKALHPDAQVLKEELVRGFVTDRGVNVRPLARSKDRLPEMNPEASEWAVELLKEDYTEYLEIAQEYWESVIVAEGRTEFTNDDLFQVFVAALEKMDPQQETGIVIKRKKGALLSWDTPSMSVGVGIAERKTVVDSPEKAFAKVLHELVAWHGGRTQKGLKTEAPILGFGVFSKFEEGERPDYLTFEEGISSLCEAMVAGEIEDKASSQWTAERLRLYANDSMFTLDQMSERETFEITWRYSLLMGLSENEQPTEAQISAAKKTAAVSIERFRRSIPANLPDEVGMIGFHKDISYLEGRIKAMSVVQNLYERRDAQSFRNLQATKTDPTNTRQREFAAKHGYPVTLTVA